MSQSSGDFNRRRTFAAVSFESYDSRLESVYALSCVYIENGRLKDEKSLEFRPIVDVDDGSPSGELFETAFEKIRSLVTREIRKDVSIPVLVWDDWAVQQFEFLILQSSDGVVMKRPPRYFKIRDYAVRRIGSKARGWNWLKIAEHYKISHADTPSPDAKQIARLMERIEDSVSFPSVVAKAFCCFCDSILEDKVVTLNEAIELRAFVTLISDKYPEFKKLEDVLDDVLDDGVVTDEESARLVRILNGMKQYFSKFIEVLKGGENRE